MLKLNSDRSTISLTIEGAGGDFNVTTCLVTLAAASGPGAVSTSCNITIINDLMVEQDETISLNATIINNNGQDARFTAGGESASATIMDDDGMTLLLCMFCRASWIFFTQLV